MLESLKAISNLETLVFEKVHVLNDPMDNLPVEKLTTLGKALKEMIDFNADPKNVMLGFKGKETYFLNLNDNTVKHSI